MSAEPQETLENGPGGGADSTPQASRPNPGGPDGRGGRMARAVLLEQILEAGESAIEPLLSILQTRPSGWPEEAPLVHAIGLLTMLRPPAALPPLIEIARDRTVDLAEEAGDALASYGQQGLEALLDLIRDPCIIGSQRATLIDCAKMPWAATSSCDPCLPGRFALFSRRSSLLPLNSAWKRTSSRSRSSKPSSRRPRRNWNKPSGKYRRSSSSALARARKTHPLARNQGPASPKDFLFQRTTRKSSSMSTRTRTRNEVDDEEEYNECLDHRPSDALSYLVLDLCDLADPLARDMIQEAFDQGLIQPEIVDAEAVDRLYASGGNELGFETTWIEDYRASYDEELRYREQVRSLPPIRFPSRTSYPSFEHREYQPPPAPVPPVEPIRNKAPKIGRNDPCWCGSGKKYKKCHLGKDAPA